MNLLWSVVGAIGFGFLSGACLTFFIWFVYNKYMDKKIRRLAEKSNIIEQMDNTKPIIDERGQEEDERRRIEKIRQFEKLRRLGIGEQTVTKSNSFYTGQFEDGKGRGLSSDVTNNIKQDSRPTGSI